MQNKKIKKYLIGLIGVLFLSATISGCATSHKDDRVVKSGYTSDARNLEVSNLHSVKLDNTFRVQGTIHNNNSFKTAQAYYRCNFYDKALFKVQDGQQWIPVQILANQSEVVECSTTNPDAATFKIELSSSGNALNVYKK